MNAQNNNKPINSPLNPPTKGVYSRRKFLTALSAASASLYVAPLLASSNAQEKLPPNLGTFSGTAEKLYILNGGYAVAPDRSVYSPGKAKKGEQVILSCYAYLIRHKNEWILWDTGIEDSIINEPGGKIIAHDIRGIVVRSIASQLSDLGLSHSDIAKVILSHAHFDHVGNAALFPEATWYIQRKEYDAMFSKNYKDYGYAPELYKNLKNVKKVLMDGDTDLYGDNAVKVISTPGHTPGHCSLLVRLAATGPVLLSADVAHFESNMEHRCVPTMNSDSSESKRSMEKVDGIIKAEKAEFWINHDLTAMAARPQLPAFFK